MLPSCLVFDISLIINLLITFPLQVAAYDKTQGKMAFFDPSRAQDFIFISGTKVCNLLLLLPTLFIDSHNQLCKFVQVTRLIVFIHDLYNLKEATITDAHTCKEQREPS